MKNNKHIKKAYEAPRVMVVVGASSEILAGSGVATPGEEQGPEGGGLAKPSFRGGLWNTELWGNDETLKNPNLWEE